MTTACWKPETKVESHYEPPAMQQQSLRNGEHSELTSLGNSLQDESGGFSVDFIRVHL